MIMLKHRLRGEDGQRLWHGGEQGREWGVGSGEWGVGSGVEMHETIQGRQATSDYSGPPDDRNCQLAGSRRRP